MKDFVSLVVGETFRYRSVMVTVLRKHEPFIDRFGRQMFRFWASRADTGAEGWIEYGPGGVLPHAENCRTGVGLDRR